MAKQQRRPATSKRSPEPEIGRVFTDGQVHRLYRGMSEEDRRDIVFAVGLKTAQRIGHRHKVAGLRNLVDLNSEWSAVDGWIVEPSEPHPLRGLGDLFGPLLDELVGRAVELLGDNADDPTMEQLREMGEEMAFERSWPQVRLLMAAVVELMFQADEQAKALSAADERFRIPD